MIRRLMATIRGQKGLLPTNAAGTSVFSLAGGYDRAAEYDKLAGEGYTFNPIGYKCVREVANSAAQIPFRVYRGDDEVEEDHPLVRLLERPNPAQAGVEFFQTLYSYLLMDGNSYAVQNVVNGRPLELALLRPDRIDIKTNNSPVPTAYEYKYDDQVVARYEVDPVTGESLLKHFKTFHPLNDHKGLSPLLAAAAEIDLFNEIVKHNIALLKNGTRPSGMLTYKPVDATGQPARLTDEQREEVKTGLKNVMGGPNNAGKPIFLEGEFTWTALGLSPRDMDFQQLKNTASRHIALCLGVPSQLVGIPDAQTYSNMAEARLALYEETVIPLALRVLSDLNEWLIPVFQASMGQDKLRIEYDFDRIPAIADRTRRLYETASLAVREGLTTRNEARAMIGLGEVDGGDEILVMGQLFPLSTIGTEPPDDPDAAEPDTSDPEADGKAAYG